MATLMGSWDRESLAMIDRRRGDQCSTNSEDDGGKQDSRDRYKSSKLEIARKYGADLVINLPEADPIGVVKEEIGGVDISFEFVGSINTITQALKITKRGGRVVLVGLTKSSLSLPLPDLLFDERAIITSIDHTRGDLKELLELMERGALNFRDSISGAVDIAQVPKLVEEMLSGRYSGLRTVIKF